VSAVPKRGHRLSPQSTSFAVCALVATSVIGTACAQSSLVHHHGVVPCGQSLRERRGFDSTDCRSDQHVWIHVHTHLHFRVERSSGLVASRGPAEILLCLDGLGVEFGCVEHLEPTLGLQGRRVLSAGGMGGAGAQGSGATATQGKRKPLVAMAPTVPP
jgi:hypothetical protein